MDNKKLAYRALTPMGENVDPVTWFRKTWTGDAFTTHALDMAGYFMLVNVMEFFPEFNRYERVPHDEDCKVALKTILIKTVELDSLTREEFWRIRTDAEDTEHLVDTGLKNALEKALATNRMLEGSLRIKLGLSVNNLFEYASVAMFLMWLEKTE